MRTRHSGKCKKFSHVGPCDTCLACVPCLKPSFALPSGAFAMQPHAARLSQYTPFQCIQLSHTVPLSLQCLRHSGGLSLRQGDGLAGAQGHCPRSQGYHPVLMDHLCMMRADCDAVRMGPYTFVQD